MKTIYLTPYDPETQQATGPSTNSGFASITEAVECLGDAWITQSGRSAFYPEQGLAVTDYVLRDEA